MAISNFTKNLVRSVFSPSLISPALRSTHKKLSYENSHSSSSELVLSARNFGALKMISKTYSFKYKNSDLERLNPLGICTVVSVVIHSNGEPELGLLSSDSEHPSYCSFSDLIIHHQV